MSASVRTVEIHPPSRSGETRAVLRAMTTIAFGALALIVLRGGGLAPGGLREGDLLPFQRLFRDVDPALQRAFRSIQEGLIEAENVRGASGKWPAPAELAAQGIPPFAPDPIDDVRTEWSLAQEGLNVSYRGIPADSSAPELLAWIQEPVPGYGEKVDARAPADETHHVLADGTVLHVTVWFRPTPSGSKGAVTQPANAGFLQILVGAQQP